VKIPDDIKQTVADVAGKVLERGQQLGKEAQLQVQIKKLQIEHAKKIHELGKRTYAWYDTGTMIASGPVPADVASLCTHINATERMIADTQLEIEAVREQTRQAEAEASIGTESTFNVAPPSQSPS
jgi:hypothetical protein